VGRYKTGLILMFGYWMLQAINAMLVPWAGLGVVTGFLTWLVFMVMAPTDIIGSTNRR
jgi:hypothetical protein